MLTIRLRATDHPDRRFHLGYAGLLLAAFPSKALARETATLLEDFPWERLLAPSCTPGTRAATVRLIGAAGALAAFWCSCRRELAESSLTHHRVYRSLLDEFGAASACARGFLEMSLRIAV
ncbi:MAG: hypothetical protein K8F56_17490 [Rhodocyclaceae bacterium]|nr:hypothetical protein [Rhodocyclaceae bacterium]